MGDGSGLVQVRCGRCGLGLFAVTADGELRHARRDAVRRVAVARRVADELDELDVDLGDDDVERLSLALAWATVTPRRASLPAIVELGEGRMVLRCTRRGCPGRPVLRYGTFAGLVARARRDRTYTVTVA